MPRGPSRHTRPKLIVAFGWQDSKNAESFFYGIKKHVDLCRLRAIGRKYLCQNGTANLARNIVRPEKMIGRRLQCTSQLHQRWQVGHPTRVEIVVQPLHGNAGRTRNIGLRYFERIDPVPKAFGELFNHPSAMRRKKMLGYKR